MCTADGNFYFFIFFDLACVVLTFISVYLRFGALNK